MIREFLWLNKGGKAVRQRDLPIAYIGHGAAGGILANHVHTWYLAEAVGFIFTGAGTVWSDKKYHSVVSILPIFGNIRAGTPFFSN